MNRLLLLPTLLCACLLISCDAKRGKALQHFDYAADELPFPRPALTGPNALPDAAPLSEKMQASLNLRRAFFARDFVPLEQAINEAHERYVSGLAKNDKADAFVADLEESQLAGIDVCKDWLAAMPRSYAAHWVCGAIWHNGAWVARSHESADKVTPIRFALMRERFARSNDLLEKAATLSSKPVEALTLSAANQFVLGNGKYARALLLQAEAIKPAYPSLHGFRINFSLPEWGGSTAEVTAAIAHAKEAGVDRDDLLYFHDNFVARPSKMSDPGAEKIYWEQAIAEQPTFFRFKSLMAYFERVNNWRDALPAASRMIEKFPDDPHGYWMRAIANEKLGHIPEALSDYRMAAARGHNYAIQALIQAHIQGGLGLAARSWDALDALCRYGAALGSAAAANCMGSMFWEGERVGAPFHTDIPQAFAWHLFAARAGYHNSQYDLGWLLLSGRAPAVEEKQAKRDGLFWMRRAAELDHQFAKKKLAEGQYSESEEVEEAPGTFDRMMEVVWPILRHAL